MRNYRSLNFNLRYYFCQDKSIGRFPYSLCLQTLELKLNLIQSLCHGPEFWRQVESHNIAGVIAIISFIVFNSVSRTIKV